MDAGTATAVRIQPKRPDSGKNVAVIRVDIATTEPVPPEQS
jgi:hypothetical protein